MKLHRFSFSIPFTCKTSKLCILLSISIKSVFWACVSNLIEACDLYSKSHALQQIQNIYTICLLHRSEILKIEIKDYYLSASRLEPSLLINGSIEHQYVLPHKMQEIVLWINNSKEE